MKSQLLLNSNCLFALPSELLIAIARLREQHPCLPLLQSEELYTNCISCRHQRWGRCICNLSMFSLTLGWADRTNVPVRPFLCTKRANVAIRKVCISHILKLEPAAARHPRFGLHLITTIVLLGELPKQPDQPQESVLCRCSSTLGACWTRNYPNRFIKLWILYTNRSELQGLSHMMVLAWLEHLGESCC